MSKNEKKDTGASRVKPAVRILALVMSILVASGAITYLALFLTDII